MRNLPSIVLSTLLLVPAVTLAALGCFSIVWYPGLSPPSIARFLRRLAALMLLSGGLAHAAVLVLRERCTLRAALGCVVMEACGAAMLSRDFVAS